MTDTNLDYVPTLTFNSTPTTPAAQAAVAQAIAEERRK